MHSADLRPTVLALGLALAGLAGPGSARADSIFSGSIDTVISFAGVLDANGNSVAKPTDLFVRGEAAPFDVEDVALGNAFAFAESTTSVNASDPDDLQVGDFLFGQSRVSGNTGYDGDSFAIALTDLFLTLENATDAAFTVRFSVDFSFDVLANIFGPGFDDAFAFASLLIGGEDADGESFEVFSESWLADVVLGPPSDAGTGSFTFDILLNPGDSVFVFAEVDADGFGVSIIPEPSSIVMMGLGGFGMLGALGVRRRRVRRAMAA